MPRLAKRINESDAENRALDALRAKINELVSPPYALTVQGGTSRVFSLVIGKVRESLERGERPWEAELRDEE